MTTAAEYLAWVDRALPPGTLRPLNEGMTVTVRERPLFGRTPGGLDDWTEEGELLTLAFMADHGYSLDYQAVGPLGITDAVIPTFDGNGSNDCRQSISRWDGVTTFPSYFMESHQFEGVEPHCAVTLVAWAKGMPNRTGLGIPIGMSGIGLALGWPPAAGGNNENQLVFRHSNLHEYRVSTGNYLVSHGDSADIFYESAEHNFAAANEWFLAVLSTWSEDTGIDQRLVHGASLYDENGSLVFSQEWTSGSVGITDRYLAPACYRNDGNQGIALSRQSGRYFVGCPHSSSSGFGWSGQVFGPWVIEGALLSPSTIKRRFLSLPHTFGRVGSREVIELRLGSNLSHELTIP